MAVQFLKSLSTRFLFNAPRDPAPREGSAAPTTLGKRNSRALCQNSQKGALLNKERKDPVRYIYISGPPIYTTRTMKRCTKWGPKATRASDTPWTPNPQRSASDRLLKRGRERERKTSFMHLWIYAFSSSKTPPTRPPPPQLNDERRAPTRTVHAP